MDNSRMNRHTCDIRIATCEFICINDVSEFALPVPHPTAGEETVLGGLEFFEDDAAQRGESVSYGGQKDYACVLCLGGGSL